MDEIPKQRDQIFICYRRDDSGATTGRIYDRLVQSFGKQTVFKDVDSIPLGINFQQHIESIIQKCSVVLVVIGDRWMEQTAAADQRRIDDARDHVRIEIEAALARDIPVVPLLVQGALMPAEETLPASVQELAQRNGTSVNNDPYFHTDMDRLIQSLKGYLVSRSSRQAHVREATTQLEPSAESTPGDSQEPVLNRETADPNTRLSGRRSWSPKHSLVLGAISFVVLTLIVISLIYFKRPGIDSPQNVNAVAPPVQSPSPAVNSPATPTPNKTQPTSNSSLVNKMKLQPADTSLLKLCMGGKELDCHTECLSNGTLWDGKTEYCDRICKRAEMIRQYRSECKEKGY